MQMPSFSYEQQYWQAGIELIAGVDEVGMGALAGPVVAAATIFERGPNSQFPMTNAQIRDSKTLSAKQREEAKKWIEENALAWAVGEATVEEINVLNIRKAAHLAMRRAIEQLTPQPHMLLIDGTPATIHDTIPSENIIGGDGLAFSIAAASIIAKVHRDALMCRLGEKFPVFGFEKHKGYGSKAHLEALQEHGPSPHHRTAYAPVAAQLERRA